MPRSKQAGASATERVVGGPGTCRAERDPARAPEPRLDAEPRRPAPTGPSFVVHKHAARRLHYDLRLELNGVLKSWAIPRGPSPDPTVRRLAVHVEDHPLDYAGFEGVIPAGGYGGGTVLLWDRGRFEPMGDAVAGYADGRLRFQLAGEKLMGGWALVRMGGRAAVKDEWLLIKERDGHAGDREEISLGDGDRSVLTGRTMAEIAAEG